VYQTAGGTATAITLTMQTLVNGYFKTFIASANNSGAATTINGKKLYKPGTTTAPNLIAGKAYTVWYNQAGDCFFIKASAEGDAIAANVLAGKKFSNDNDTGLVGTLDLSNLVSGNIKSGVTINGVNGKASVVDTVDGNASAGQILNGQTAYINGNKVTGNMPNNYGTWQYSGVPMVGTHRLHMYPPKGYYDPAGGTGIYYDDSGFDPANIVNGKSIFGLTGNATVTSLGGRQYTSGPATSNTTVTLPFNPSIIKVNSSVNNGGITFLIWTPSNYNGYPISAQSNANGAGYNGSIWVVRGNQIIFSTLNSSYTWTWEAWQ
jgi:hypothetical protein